MRAALGNGVSMAGGTVAGGGAVARGWAVAGGLRWQEAGGVAGVVPTPSHFSLLSTTP